VTSTLYTDVPTTPTVATPSTAQSNNGKKGVDLGIYGFAWMGMMAVVGMVLG
jgi:hypothetical protein